MEYRQFGRTGVRVSPICLGTLNFGAGTTEPDSIRMIHAALDAGINLIDTSNNYHAGESERTVGRAMAGRRSQVVLATKVHGRTGPGPNDLGNSRLHVLKACDDSLRRLGTDYIDLYQVHRPSPEIPIDETLGALTDLVRAGKVRYIGCSTHPAWMVMEALAASERLGLARYVSEQPPYNLLDRRIENELIPLAMRYDLAILPWGPLAQGVLAGRYPDALAMPSDSRVVRFPGANNVYAERVTAAGIEVGRRFAAVARDHGKTAGQFALLWCKDQPGVTSPVVGPRTMEQLTELLPVVEMSLTAEERSACDRLVAPGGVVANFHNSAPWMKSQVPDASPDASPDAAGPVVGGRSVRQPQVP
ncbi:MAG: aldo/keto reductase [Acidobacteriota bacterium]